MSLAFLLFLAMLLDAVMGEPKWLWTTLPHPAVLIGRAVGYCDTRFNTGTQKRRNGILVLIGLVLAAGLLGYIISLFGGIVTVIVAAILLAQKSLAQHVGNVAQGLRMSLAEGRRQVAMIVGRDTRNMDQNAVTRSAIESGAENLSDGVIAPAFWFLIGGLPGLLIYKIVNTADSMIGYRTERHEEFGWAAARFDDLLNWIPARLTAVLIALPAGVIGQMKLIQQDAKLHRSPNAGWPESAMARALNVALSGPRSYDGTLQDFPWVHADGNHTPDQTAIDAACAMLWKAWAVLLMVVFVIALF
ncbi:MAG: adenosylcobinamide-phosphate synthase CbiB [Ascidiaceihabitans sp.]|nr:adenosylcobinamide-phosphate synthase CbiB [Ascidiaceihabitans sp.]